MFDLDNIKLLAKCIWLEARSDGLTGMHAVAHCIKNRIGAVGFPATLYLVIHQPNAFSWTRLDNPEHDTKPVDVPPANLWSEALRLADLVLNTDDADPTGGAHYYENPKTATSGWFQRIIVDNPEVHPMTVKIEHHTFYI
jgi:N-acetylmuramoyl-L-alanine amidase